MAEAAEIPADVLAFIEGEIDSVPHMEALLLLWDDAAREWTAAQIAERLYVGSEAAGQILADLLRRRLVRVSDESSGRFAYDPGWDPSGELMAKVAASYRRHLIRVVHVIHAKASRSVREFARAFEIKKDG